MRHGGPSIAHDFRRNAEESGRSGWLRGSRRRAGRLRTGRGSLGFLFCRDVVPDLLDEVASSVVLALEEPVLDLRHLERHVTAHLQVADGRGVDVDRAADLVLIDRINHYPEVIADVKVGELRI